MKDLNDQETKIDNIETQEEIVNDQANLDLVLLRE